MRALLTMVFSKGNRYSCGVFDMVMRKNNSVKHRKAVPIMSVLTSLMMVCGVVFTLPSATEAHAVPASAWNPGFIISDEALYNYSSMTAAQIQTFLNDKGASCQSGAVPCLKDYKVTTRTMAKDDFCSAAYQGANDETAATVIAKVAAACRINPQVIIVTLQKETSLVTTTSPTESRYRTATGYGCPDTSACDSQYYGFFNQVYMTAHQLRKYAALPSNYSFKAKATNTIAYNPNSSCGSSKVYIENQATASLYNYTPYQPNQAALKSLYGTGDSCSSYGNRNFWTFFVDWFGDTENPALGKLKTLGAMTWILNTQSSSNTSFGVAFTTTDKSMPKLTWQIYDIAQKTWSTVASDAPNWITYQFPRPGQYLVHVEGMTPQGQLLRFDIGWTVQAPQIYGFTWTNIKDLKGDFGVAVQYADPGTQYQWQYYDISAKTWALLQDWNTSNWVTWQMPKKGSYLLYVTVKPPTGSNLTSAMGWVTP